MPPRSFLVNCVTIDNVKLQLILHDDSQDQIHKTLYHDTKSSRNRIGLRKGHNSSCLALGRPANALEMGVGKLEVFNNAVSKTQNWWEFYEGEYSI